MRVYITSLLSHRTSAGRAEIRKYRVCIIYVDFFAVYIVCKKHNFAAPVFFSATALYWHHLTYDKGFDTIEPVPT